MFTGRANGGRGEMKRHYDGYCTSVREKNAFESPSDMLAGWPSRFCSPLAQLPGLPWGKLLMASLKTVFTAKKGEEGEVTVQSRQWFAISAWYTCLCAEALTNADVRPDSQDRVCDRDGSRSTATPSIIT